MGGNVTTPDGPTSRKVLKARRELVKRLPRARFGRVVVDDEWLGGRLREELGEAGSRFPWRAARLRTELVAAMPQAGDDDDCRLEGLLATLDRLSSRPRAWLAPGVDPPDDLLFQPVNATDLPRIRRPSPGEPDFDWDAAAAEHMASWGRLPCDPQPRDALMAMRVAYLSDIARCPLDGAVRRVPPALPQPGPPPVYDWGDGVIGPADDAPELLRCHACALLGRGAVLTRSYGPLEADAEERGAFTLRSIISCEYDHESYDGSRRRALARLPDDAQAYYRAVDDGRTGDAEKAYGYQPLGSVAEALVNGEPQRPVPTRRTVENWRTDGRRALARLGFWPWVAAPEEGKLGRVWWREARYADVLQVALDCEAQRIENYWQEGIARQKQS